MSRFDSHPDRAYSRTFWLAYLANALVMIAMSMLVRYADFVTYLGGAEGQLGLIVGVGMVGSLAMRFGQAVGIDRYGPRRIWLWSLVFFVASLAAHTLVESASGPGIFLLRVAMQTSLAGIFGASITYISRRVPPTRMAEIIGTLGTSGFVGILIGPQIADWIFRAAEVTRPQLDLLFLSTAALGCLALLAAWAATRGEVLPPPRRRPHPLALLRRYNPGVVLLVACAVGAGVSLPHTFLRTYAAELELPRIGLFFIVYAVTAFIVRMSARRLFERYGNRPWVVCGLTALALSALLYLVVRSTWQLVIPGAMAGVAHALLFPAVVASGSTAFPVRHRGLATTLMLGMFDIGTLVGAPAIGGTLHFAREIGLPAYPTMFLCVAAAYLMIATFFAIHTRRGRGGPRQAAPAGRAQPQRPVVDVGLPAAVLQETCDVAK